MSQLRTWTIATGLILLAYAVARSLPGTVVEPHAYYRDSAFEVIAHGGGRGLKPNDTLEAAQHAYQLQADVLEIDIHSSIDGVLVLSHDETVDAQTNGSGLIREMTFAQLQQLDAAQGFDAEQGTSLSNTGIRIPALEAVFTALPKARYMIEIKQQSPSIAGPLCAMLRKHGLQQQVLVASFGSQALDEFRQHCPEVATSFSQPETTWLVLLHKLGLAHLYPLKGVALQVPVESSGISIVTPRFVQDMHNRGLQVQVWTINDEQQMRELIELGVDGIITDYPNRLRSVVGKPHG